VTLEPFKSRVLVELVPAYCSLPSRNMTPEGFKQDWGKITETDAVDFLRAMDSGLIFHIGYGRYRSPKSNAAELFFWEGRKAARPRPFGLWAEAIITVAVLARLHFDLGWPKHLLGTQSIGFSFDVVAHADEQATCEHIACEVKKSTREVDELVRLMTQFGKSPGEPRPIEPKENNAFQKVLGLRERKAPLFWAVGPERYCSVYRVLFGSDGQIEFESGSMEDLRYRSPSSRSA
jgi:hypothetical protein